jgi:hypothetical protein
MKLPVPWAWCDHHIIFSGCGIISKGNGPCFVTNKQKTISFVTLMLSGRVPVISYSLIICFVNNFGH